MAHIGYRPTWAEVDLDNLAHNYRCIRRRLAPRVKIMACVKADAYGHGIIAVSRRLSVLGVDYLSVASIDEAIVLRQAGIRLPILILGVILPQDYAPLAEYDLVQTVCSAQLARALQTQAARQGKKIKVQVKVDTGMGRIGVQAKDAFSFIAKISQYKNIRIEGVFTHLSCADTDRVFTLQQIDIFAALLKRLRSAGLRIPLAHAANSLGVMQYPQSHFNMARPGLIIYGLQPAPRIPLKLKPVLALKTKIVHAKTVPADTGISYGRTYITQKTTRIVTLPIGYGDGYPRNLSNQAPVLIHGKRFTVSGRVCMDQIMVDVGSTPARIGEEVVLIGRQGRGVITAEELAVLSGTIPYEIVCGLGSRIPRVYI